MNTIKTILGLATLAGLFYLANTVPFNGKTTIEHLSSFWDSGVIQEQVADVKNDVTSKLEEAAHKNDSASKKKGAEEVEDYSEQERKVITDAIGEYL